MLTILNLTFLMQVILSATLSCLLPLQLGFKGFQYISFSKLNLICYNQSTHKSFNVWPSLVCHSMYSPGKERDIIFGSVNHFGWT